MQLLVFRDGACYIYSPKGSEKSGTSPGYPPVAEEMRFGMPVKIETAQPGRPEQAEQDSFQ